MAENARENRQENRREDRPLAEGPALPPGPAFDAQGLAKTLLRETRAGALATLDRASGFPFASLVTVATAPDGSPIMLLSRLSAHTLNLEADPRATLLLSRAGKGDPLAHPRLTVVGRAERSQEPGLRRRFLARHPKAELYADFPDFSFFRLTLEAAALNGGFARAATLTAAELVTPLDGAEGLIEAEAGACAHMNEDHADALALYAERLCKAGPGDWRATGIDPDGLDLAAGDRTARLPFPERITDAGALRRVLKRLADEARGTPA
jgi:heme iron utilization protein